MSLSRSCPVVHTLLSAALCGASLAHAGRPLSVDDAGLNEAGRGHVEAWWMGAQGTSGTLTIAPAYAPTEGLEVAAQLARDRDAHATLQSLSAKKQWSAEPEDTGCHAASSVAATRLHSAAKRSTQWQLTMIGTCKLGWAAAHANLGALRSDSAWLPTWGLALERELAPRVSAHAETFGQRHGKPTFQAGLRHEWESGWQVDGTLGRQASATLWSVGLKRRF